MSDFSQAAPPGWYWAEGDPPNTMRYWDGRLWHGEPQAVAPAAPADPGPASRSLGSINHHTPRQFSEAELAAVRDRRQAIRNEQIRRTGTRQGEGIPFHEMYMRTRSRKGTWRS